MYDCETQGLSAALDMGIQLRDVQERPVGTLSGGEQQCLAIARAIHFGAKVLILNESHLGASGAYQASVVLKLIVQSKARGIGVIFISAMCTMPMWSVTALRC